MKRGKKAVFLAVKALAGMVFLGGCAAPSGEVVLQHEENSTEAESRVEAKDGTKAEKRFETELVYESSMELAYAENFSVDYYEGGYTMLTLMDGEKFLLIPEEQEVLPEIPEGVTVLERPMNHIYLVASAAMNMFCELEALDSVSLSGQKAENWYVEEAREAMEQGTILYAGKYNKPDYELILSNNCRLTIENRMISHSPEVMEKLEEFGIPVMIEYSSYESHPLGRVEWVKFYGTLLGREEEAETVFQKQTEIVEKVTAQDRTGKSVAFFFLTSNGMVQVRTSADYVPKMIELAGGRYIFESLGEETAKRSTINLQLEEFYNTAKEADYLIYNSTIDGGISSVAELLDKCRVLKDFKAVKENNVWCTTNDMYQQSLSIGYLIEDMHNMLTGEEEKQTEMKYLFRLPKESAKR